MEPRINIDNGTYVQQKLSPIVQGSSSQLKEYKGKRIHYTLEKYASNVLYVAAISSAVNAKIKIQNLRAIDVWQSVVLGYAKKYSVKKQSSLRMTNKLPSKEYSKIAQ